MKFEYWPVLVVVAFVIYPFAMMAVCAGIVSCSGRVRFLLPVAKVFALFGCVIAAWFMLRNGLGKIPSVTVIGSAVFVLAVAATGGVLGSLIDLFVPPPDAHGEGNGPPSPHSHDPASQLSDVKLLVRANCLASIAALVSIVMWLASIRQIGAPTAVAAAVALCCGLFGIIFSVWLAIRDSQLRILLLGIWALAPLLWVGYFLLVLHPSAIGP